MCQNNIFVNFIATTTIIYIYLLNKKKMSSEFLTTSRFILSFTIIMSCRLTQWLPTSHHYILPLPTQLPLLCQKKNNYHYHLLYSVTLSLSQLTNLLSCMLLISLVHTSTTVVTHTPLLSTYSCHHIYYFSRCHHHCTVY